MSVKFKLLYDHSIHPAPATKGSSGYDCHAFLIDSVTIEPKHTALIPLGFSIKIPYGYEGQIRSRSGLALKQGLIVLNSPGTIDSDYEGEVNAIIHNISQHARVVSSGERICQLVISKIEPPMWSWVAGDADKIRGSGGFGSTGV